MADFIAIDFETATESPQSAISVGLVRYRGLRAISSYYSLVRPPKLYVREDFADLHGLTVDDVRDAPDFAHVWENGAKNFIGSTLLVAHRAAFDMRVLKSVLGFHGLPVPGLRYFCTHGLARRAWPGLESYALASLARKFGIVYEAHNALDDAMTCGKLVAMSAERFPGHEGVEALLEAAGVEVKSLRP